MKKNISIPEMNELNICVDLTTMKNKELGSNLYGVEPYPEDWSGDLIEFMDRLPGDYALWSTAIGDNTTYAERIKIIKAIKETTEDKNVIRFADFYAEYKADNMYMSFVRAVISTLGPDEIKDAVYIGLTDKPYPGSK